MLLLGVQLLHPFLVSYYFILCWALVAAAEHIEFRVPGNRVGLKTPLSLPCFLLAALGVLYPVHILRPFIMYGFTYGEGEEEEEGFDKLLPANKADHLCQLWQSCPIC